MLEARLLETPQTVPPALVFYHFLFRQLGQFAIGILGLGRLQI